MKEERKGMSSHFRGQSVENHLLEKKIEGLRAIEPHGLRWSNVTLTALDAAQEVLILVSFIWFLSRLQFIPLFLIKRIYLPVAVGWSLWKGGWSFRADFVQCDRLHRLLEEERSEIENNREEEREELRELYRAKGLEGKLLDEVVHTLMVDDTRCLQVMLEEEFGLTLGVRPHPLQIGCAAWAGSFLSALCSYPLLFWIDSPLTPVLLGGELLLVLLYFVRHEKSDEIPTIVWGISLLLCALYTVYFLSIVDSF